MNLEEMTLQLLCSVCHGQPSFANPYSVETCFQAAIKIRELVKEHEAKNQPGPFRTQAGEAIS